MKNKISVYELLGLIKDGKAPKKIKWEDYIFSFYNDDYLCKNEDFIKNRETNYLLCYLFSLPGSALNIKVEILEEDKPIIEKMDLFDDLQDILNNSDESIVLNAIHKCLTVQKYKLNEIIDYINKKEKDN